MKQLERFYLPAVVCLALLILGGVGLLVFRSAAGNDGAEIVISTPSSASRQIEISVSGAVLRPGVYTLQSGATLQDALNAAGGATSEAASASVNLAAPVRNGDQLRIPTAAELPQRININTADAWLLEALPGVGAELSGRIIEYRNQNGPFTRTEDLTRVKGISQSVFEKIKDRITVNQP